MTDLTLSKKIDDSQTESEKKNYITKRKKYITKKEKKPVYIKRKDSAQTSEKETVSDAQKRGKIPLNFNKGGRVNLKDGGCAQIKGFGKARRPKKKKYA